MLAKPAILKNVRFFMQFPSRIEGAQARPIDELVTDLVTGLVQINQENRLRAGGNESRSSIFQSVNEPEGQV